MSIIIKEGSSEMLPWVEVEITPGRWPFQWWFEVSYYDPDNEMDGQKVPCWVHDYEKDGGGFGLWFVMRKAAEVLQDCWSEEFNSKYRNNPYQTK